MLYVPKLHQIYETLINTNFEKSYVTAMIAIVNCINGLVDITKNIGSNKIVNTTGRKNQN